MNNIYEIYVSSYNGEVPLTKTSHKLYGKKYAMNVAKEIGSCDNVNRVELIDASTGELLLIIEEGEVKLGSLIKENKS